ncbi:hypothetical protein [Celeribacter arenosi]
MSQKTHQIAVLTGDLVGSTKLGAQKIERAFAALENCARLQEAWMGAPLHFTRHRGDGWQVALAEPKYALRSGLAFRAALKALGPEFDSYIGIAQGTVTGDIATDLNDATEEVFQASGRSLEAAKSSKHRLKYNKGGAHEGMAILLGRVSGEWTANQAATILYALPPNSSVNSSQIARELDKSRQSVSKTLEAAWVDEVRDALMTMENT